MDIDTERLKKRWDGRSEYVIDGETTYRVFTPNGPEEPVFVPQSTAGMYDQTSTGFVQAQEQTCPAFPPQWRTGVRRRRRRGL